METINNTFKGFKAVITNDAGKSSNCFVVNYRYELKFNDGTSGEAYKVKPAHRYLVQGGHRYAESYGTAIWVKASKISK